MRGLINMEVAFEVSRFFEFRFPEFVSRSSLLPESDFPRCRFPESGSRKQLPGNRFYRITDFRETACRNRFLETISRKTLSPENGFPGSRFPETVSRKPFPGNRVQETVSPKSVFPEIVLCHISVLCNACFHVFFIMNWGLSLEV